MTRESIEEIRRVFEIDGVDEEDLSKLILSNLKRHQLQTPDNWPAFAVNASDVNRSSDTAEYMSTLLEQASRYYDGVSVQMSPVDSRVPWLGHIKRLFHRLVLYYVNQLGQRQIVFNDRILRIAGQLTVALGDRESEIARLRQQLADLEMRLHEIERQEP